MIHRTLFAGGLAAILGAAPLAAAAVIHVPADFGDIQSAIDAAADGDEIVVAPGIYTSTEDWVFEVSGFLNHPNNLYIHSSGSEEDTFIDGQHARGGFSLYERDAVIEGFTIRNGYRTGPDGSAQGMGGGAYIYISAPEIRDCIFRDNEALGDGGAGGGGAVSMRYSGNPHFINCAFNDNYTSTVGGGLSARFGSTPTLTDCSLCNNVPDHIEGPWNDDGGNSFSDGPCFFDDCNNNGIDDMIDVADGTSADCNGNGIPDECDIADGYSGDCNGNGIPDECDLFGEPPAGAVQWPAADGGNDHWYLAVDVGTGSCWEDSRLQAEALGGHLVTITSQSEQDFLEASVINSSVWWWVGGYQDLDDPDYSEPGGAWKWVTGEPWDYTNWYSGQPANTGENEHYLQIGMTWWNLMWKDAENCNSEQSWMVVEYPSLATADCNGNGIPDECDIADGTSTDCNTNAIPDECEDLADCDGNGTPDLCELLGGAPDINPADGIPDSCQGLPTGGCCMSGMCVETSSDNCDASGGTYAGDGVSCGDTSCEPDCVGDVDGTGTVDVDDLMTLIGAWGACP
jgi:hypothetical protein